MRHSISPPRSPLVHVIIYAFILIFSSSPDPFLAEADDRNYLLIFFMSSLIIFVPVLKNITKKDLLTPVFMLWILIVSLIHENTRWSSVFFLLMFCYSFMFFIIILRSSNLSVANYRSALSSIILLYAAALVVQQISVLFGFHPPLAGNYFADSPWKLSSIAAEPSVAVFNVALLCYSFITVGKAQRAGAIEPTGVFGTENLVLYATYWVLLTSFSSTGLLLALILLLYKLDRKSIITYAPLVLGAISLSALFQPAAFVRFEAFFTSIFTFNIENIILADHSGSYRLVPAILLIEKIDLFSSAGFLGHGNSFVANYLYTVMPGTPYGHVAGGFAVTLLEHGLISFSILSAIIVLHGCRKSIFDFIFIITILLFANGLNNQLVWFGLIILSANKYFMRFTPPAADQHFRVYQPSHSI